MSRTVQLSIFVALLGAAVSVSITCPYLEDLKPCTCVRIAHGSLVRCANFNSSSILERVLKIIGDYEVHTLLLHNVHIKEILPINLFKGLKIKKIQIGESFLRFEEPAFAGLDTSLSVLNVEKDSMIKSKGKFKIAKLSKLKELGVKNNIIQEVDDAWLKDKVPNLKEVVLDFNGIQHIQDHAFSSMPHLEQISLSDNRIREVKRSMFPDPAMQLYKIDLR